MPVFVDHDERRRQVVAVASRLIAEAGLDAVTVRDVANAAGCSTAIVSHYFHNKKELLFLTYRASIDRATERANLAVGADGTDLRGLLAQIIYMVVKSVPIGSPTGSLWFVALILAVFYVGETIHHQRIAWALFVLPLVLGLIRRQRHVGWSDLLGVHGQPGDHRVVGVHKIAGSVGGDAAGTAARDEGGEVVGPWLGCGGCRLVGGVAGQIDHLAAQPAGVDVVQAVHVAQCLSNGVSHLFAPNGCGRVGSRQARRAAHRAG